MMTKSDLLYALLSVMIAFIIAIITLVAMQRQMIYHPRRYPDHIELPKTIKPINYIVNKSIKLLFCQQSPSTDYTMDISKWQCGTSTTMAAAAQPDTSQCGFYSLTTQAMDSIGVSKPTINLESVQNAVHEIKHAPKHHSG